MPAPSPATSAECPRVADTVSDVAAFNVIGSAPKFMAWARFCASACVRFPEISPRPWNDVGLAWVGWMMGAEYTCPSSSIPSNWWKFAAATLSHNCEPAAPASV